jgi:hypothetical protein
MNIINKISVIAMSSKREKGGKGMGKNFESIADKSNRYNEDEAASEENKYPGAYKEGTKVLALMRDNMSWKVAEIYAVREAKFFNEMVNEDDIVDNQIYDDLPVMEHPPTNQEGKQTYMEKYLSELRAKWESKGKPD